MRSYFVFAFMPVAVAVTFVSQAPCAGLTSNLPTISRGWTDAAGAADATAAVAVAAGLAVAATSLLRVGAVLVLLHAPMKSAATIATTTRLISLPRSGLDDRELSGRDLELVERADSTVFVRGLDLICEETRGVVLWNAEAGGPEEIGGRFLGAAVAAVLEGALRPIRKDEVEGGEALVI